MASILDRYGIKEVADVTFYKIKEDGSKGDPVLYLDTLKVLPLKMLFSLQNQWPLCLVMVMLLISLVVI